MESSNVVKSFMLYSFVYLLEFIVFWDFPKLLRYNNISKDKGETMHQNSRKSLYFMPFITIEETIEIKELRLIKNTSQHDDIMPDLFIGGGGIFVEIINKFQSANTYDSETHMKINNMIELLKFSYYTIVTPTGGGFPGFISESTFELFPIIEANKDQSFEHKTAITNGVSNFLMKQEDYYLHKTILGNGHNVEISKYYLSYFELIYNDCINNENKLSIVRLYNKCLRITDINDCFDKIIFARASIETLIKINNSFLTKKNYIKSFINKLEIFIEKNDSFNEKLFEFYLNKVKNNDGLEKSEKNLDKYLISLANARHDLVHENKANQNFRTIEVYIAWFPLFFLSTFFEEKLKESDITRFILFLKLLQLDNKTWNTKDRKNYSKMTCLEVYAQYTSTIIANIDDSTLISNCLEGFNGCFNFKES